MNGAYAFFGTAHGAMAGYACWILAGALTSDSQSGAVIVLAGVSLVTNLPLASFWFVKMLRDRMPEQMPTPPRG